MIPRVFRKLKKETNGNLIRVSQFNMLGIQKEI